MPTTLYPVSAKFLAAVAGSHKVATKVEVWHGTTFLQTITSNLSTGHISVDSTAAQRRTATLVLHSLGWPHDNLVPRQPGDLIHPASCNELRISRGVRYSTGSTEYALLGVFRMSHPKVRDTDVALSITLSAYDRSSIFQRRKWYTPFVIHSTTPVSTAIKAILRNRTSGIALTLIQSSTVKVGPLSYAVTPYNVNSTTAWGTAQQLALTAGMELYFNVTGLPVLQPLPTPKTQSIQLTFQTGGVVTGTISRTFSETTQYNGVVGIGTGPGGTPIRIEKWTSTSKSRTFAGTTAPSQWGHVPFIFKTDIIPALGQTRPQALAQLQDMVNTIYRLVVNAFDVPSFSIVPNPALLEGNCIRLIRPRLGLSNTYIVTALTIPLMADSPMTVSCRGPQIPQVTG